MALLAISNKSGNAMPGGNGVAGGLIRWAVSKKGGHTSRLGAGSFGRGAE